MGILSIYTDTTGQVNVLPRRVKIISSDNLGTVTAAGYLNAITLESFVIYNTDIIDMWYGATGSVPNLTTPGTYAEFIPSFSNGVITLVAQNASQTGPVVVNKSVASATPGTVRSLTGALTESVLLTSGNIVGVRGSVTYVGASGGFVYGTQGKIICTGALTGSEWSAGIFGQVDISAATINAGQLAPIWGDYGTSSGTLTNQTGLYGIAMTNTTAAVLAGQLYLYGGATTLMLLNTNSGLSGVTYFKTSGTGAGSWGNATPPTPSKVLTISVDGTLYYLPLVAQNT